MNLGSVVKFNNEKYVITGFKNYETVGSCSYDRDYYLLPLNEMINKTKIKENEGIKVEVRGMPKQFPLEEIKDEAPFELTKQINYIVRRKQPKTITIFE